jgi:hypothetical protein
LRQDASFPPHICRCASVSKPALHKYGDAGRHMSDQRPLYVAQATCGDSIRKKSVSGKEHLPTSQVGWSQGAHDRGQLSQTASQHHLLPCALKPTLRCHGPRQAYRITSVAWKRRTGGINPRHGFLYACQNEADCIGSVLSLECPRLVSTGVDGCLGNRPLVSPSPRPQDKAPDRLREAPRPLRVDFH